LAFRYFILGYYGLSAAEKAAIQCPILSFPANPNLTTPLFEILYPEGKSIKIYLDGHVDGAEGAIGIVNHTSLLTDALWNARHIPDETLRDRFRRVMAPWERYFSKSQAV
jgi:hypothetical protein